MTRHRLLTCGLVLLALGTPTAQTEIVTGDYATALAALTAPGNVGIRNAVLRNQPEVRVFRVAVEAGGRRVIHAHDDVAFHLFIPISGPMVLEREGVDALDVTPWRPVYLEGGTRHGFHNPGSTPVDILEIFVP